MYLIASPPLFKPVLTLPQKGAGVSIARRKVKKHCKQEKDSANMRDNETAGANVMKSYGRLTALGMDGGEIGGGQAWSSGLSSHFLPPQYSSQCHLYRDGSQCEMKVTRGKREEEKV